MELSNLVSIRFDEGAMKSHSLSPHWMRISRSLQGLTPIGQRGFV
jgi:hypothetical protein